MQTLHWGRFGMLVAGSLVISTLSAPGATAAEASPTSEVKDASTWVEQAYEVSDNGATLDPDQDDVDGPARTPYGTGSHRLRIGQSTVQTELYRTPDYDGMQLADVTRLEYSTFARRTSGDGPDRQPTYLRLNVDNDADGARDASLFFFPANNADQQPVANGVWQNWDVGNGKISVDGDSGPGGTTTIDQYVTAHPTSTLVNNNGGQPDGGSIALINGGSQGGDTDPQTNGEYFVDRVIVGESDDDTLYDFGPSAETDGGETPYTVDPAHAHEWYHQAYDSATDEDLTSSQKFVEGPAAPPAGGGSLRFTLSNDTNPNRIELFRTPQYDGTLVRDLRTLEYSTFQRPTAPNATPQQPATLRLNVDDDGDGTRDHSLYYSPANNGTVEQGAWQEWDADSGKWSVDGDTGPANTVTLENYAVAHPDSVIVNNAGGNPLGGGVAFFVGAAGDGQMDGQYFIDDVAVGAVDADTGHVRSTDRFDLEPDAPAASVGNDRVREGNDGATLVFPVTLNGPAGKDVVLDYETDEGTAKAGTDFKAKAGSLTIPAGETYGEVQVKVLSDKRYEPDERMRLLVSSAGYGTVADGVGRGTIVNDDTRVGLELSQASEHRVRAKVDTLDPAKGAPVKIHSVRDGEDKVVFSGDLNRYGRLSEVLAKHYQPGTVVTLYAVVTTDAGEYKSTRERIVIT